MKLTSKAREAISDRKIMLSLAFGLGFTEIWVKKLIEANKDNGPLTTAKSMQVIREETGLGDSDILEETVAAEQI